MWVIISISFPVMLVVNYKSREYVKSYKQSMPFFQMSLLMMCLGVLSLSFVWREYSLKFIARCLILDREIIPDGNTAYFKMFLFGYVLLINAISHNIIVLLTSLKLISKKRSFLDDFKTVSDQGLSLLSQNNYNMIYGDPAKRNKHFVIVMLILLILILFQYK